MSKPQCSLAKRSLEEKKLFKSYNSQPEKPRGQRFRRCSSPLKALKRLKTDESPAESTTLPSYREVQQTTNHPIKTQKQQTIFRICLNHLKERYRMLPLKKTKTKSVKNPKNHETPPQPKTLSSKGTTGHSHRCPPLLRPNERADSAHRTNKQPVTYWE